MEKKCYSLQLFINNITGVHSGDDHHEPGYDLRKRAAIVQTRARAKDVRSGFYFNCLYE